MTSVTTGSPVSSRALASSRRPSSPRPWNEYGLVRGLNAPPRSSRAPLCLTAAAASGDRGARPPEARRRGARADLHDGRLADELTRGELEGLQDPNAFRDPGKRLEHSRFGGAPCL